MNLDRDHPAITRADGPSADGDPMGTPASNERILWKGRPNLPVLTRTAFHMGSYAIYFTMLIVIALAFGNTSGALFLACAGMVGALVLQLIAWHCMRSTLYILTDTRLIMRIGMAIEMRINIPLKHIRAGHLNMRGGDHGDIAVELNGDRLLGYVLLWPHVRPFHFNHPQPMLRAVPDAQTVAKLLAEACGEFNLIESGLIDLDVSAARAGHGKQDTGLEGATA